MSEYNLMQMDKKDMLLYYIGSMLALSRGMRSNEFHCSHQTLYSKHGKHHSRRHEHVSVVTVSLLACC